MFTFLLQNQEVVAKFTSTIFENTTLIGDLNKTGYDLFLTDPTFPGGVLLAHYLQLPLVYNVRWLFSGEAHLAVAPSPLSYVPICFSHNSDKMDFFQRIRNMIHYIMFFYMEYYVSRPPYQALCDHYFGNNVSLMSLTQKADLWLMRVDFTFEFPRPTMPNVIYVGGFQGKPSKPLPSDLPQKVVWRHVGKRPATLGNNTMLVEWLPQNDLLGHPKTKVFVTHGGTNGLYEAIYHGVPVLGIPLIFDQHDNLLRMEARGVAEIVDVAKLDVDSLTSALKNILDPEKPYKQNMLKLSQLHHDQPMKPLDSAIFWMEYVMRHKGAAHLRTESYKLPWYACHCLDVMAVLVAFGLLIIALVWTSCQCLITFLLNTKKSKHE
ncbi:UDP-glucuronosyltransferase 2B20-like [Pelmatolapia mariae]|uniref:UDP-glucuronosyltransferase 2B20-like n=1 Tax=Pelmatolapia mariae TaxID=158779 RepID=UPI002FE515A2